MCRREAASEALTGARTGQPSSRERSNPGCRRRLGYGRQHGRARYASVRPIRRVDPGMCARFLYHGNREISCLAVRAVPAGPHREDEESKPMTHEREKSDSAIVAGKPVNKAVWTAKERVEPRAGTKGNASGHDTHRTQRRLRVSQVPERVRSKQPPPPKPITCLHVIHPRWEPYALINGARTDLCGGREVTHVPTAIRRQ